LAEPVESEDLHTLKNYLSVVIVMTGLLLADLSEDDLMREDLAAIRQAGIDAMAILPRLASRVDG
jgi:hypothetical protein